MCISLTRQLLCLPCKNIRFPSLELGNFIRGSCSTVSLQHFLSNRSLLCCRLPPHFGRGILFNKVPICMYLFINHYRYSDNSKQPVFSSNRFKLLQRFRTFMQPKTGDHLQDEKNYADISFSSILFVRAHWITWRTGTGPELALPNTIAHANWPGATTL